MTRELQDDEIEQMINNDMRNGDKPAESFINEEHYSTI